MSIREKIRKQRHFRRLLEIVFRHFGGNRFRGLRGNDVAISGILRNVDVRIRGRENVVVVRDPRYVRNFKVFINGSGNRIEIGENCLLKDLTLWIEDDDNTLFIGRDTIFCGSCQLNCIEGTALTVGERCMFAENVNIRTGDSHSVLDETGKRINRSKDIRIGNHVWFGQNVMVLKGSEIGDDSVCAAGTIVTGAFPEKGRILAGVPAKAVRENVSWCYERI